MDWLNLLSVSLYTLSILGLSLYGVQSLILLILFFRQRRNTYPTPVDPEVWPSVIVQLPIFNEHHVVERLIDAACALDYPVERLLIQVLDDSTDHTTRLAQCRVDYHRLRGVNIVLIHRDDRLGFKAGALAQGLRTAAGELVAIFDADFIPPPDFLRRLVPYLSANPRLGMVQARWGHLNAEYSAITRGEAIFLDAHFVVEQTARSRTGLLFNFNGSAGVWRKSCIEDAGGWQGDTLAEDLDLSYRAQLKGWKLLYLPDFVASAEVSPQIAAFKRQQFRWAHGAIHVLLKVGPSLVSHSLSLRQRVFALLHLSAYLAHLLMLILLAACLPVILSRGQGLPSLQWLSLVGLAPSMLFVVSQWAIYPDWKRRIAYLPVLICLGIGVGLNNGVAVILALAGRREAFKRTPKFHLETKQDSWLTSSYRLPIDWTVWGELALSIYALITLVLAVRLLPALIPMMVLFAAGFGFTGLAGLWQGRRSRLPVPKRRLLRNP